MKKILFSGVGVLVSYGILLIAWSMSTYILLKNYRMTRCGYE